MGYFPYDAALKLYNHNHYLSRKSLSPPSLMTVTNWTAKCHTPITIATREPTIINSGMSAILDHLNITKVIINGVVINNVTARLIHFTRVGCVSVSSSVASCVFCIFIPPSLFLCINIPFASGLAFLTHQFDGHNSCTLTWPLQKPS